MLRPIKGFDRQESNAHWFLLSGFVHPRDPFDFTKYRDWESVLGEPPRQAIERFSKEGLVEIADLVGTLSYKYGVSELKAMLRQRGLLVSGRKDEMIQRLVDADPEYMKENVAGLTCLVCTQHGMELADKYNAAEKEKRMRIEQQTIEYIRKRDFEKASLIVIAYEVEQVFPRGMVDWEHHKPDREIGLLNTIFDNKPKILAKLGNDKLEDLRIGAAMMVLWGKNKARQWLPPNFETGTSMDADTTARMFEFYALNQATLRQWRESGLVVYVNIFNNCPDSCDSCKKLLNKKYKLDEIPELPHEHCTNEMGCRCLVNPIID
jgi:hypothetical protein